MATVSPSEMAATRIPKITDLRDQLHYGDARLLRCSAFSDDLRVFRRRYSSKGIRGADLWDWKSSEHQAALNDMTANFLDDQSYGELYWPSDPTSPNFNSLQYSEDRAFITKTLKQLIFRLNLQQYRNRKYKQKEQHQSDPRVHEIIDLEPEEPRTGFNFPTISASVENPTSTPSVHNSPSLHVLPSGLDEYDSPTSPDYEPEESAQTKRKLNAGRKNPPAKRTKTIRLKVPLNKVPMNDTRQTVPKANWTSPRGKKTVQRTSYANVYDLDLSDVDDDVRPSHPAKAKQSTGNIEDVINYIRTNRPSVTCETVPPTPTIGQRKLTHDSHIDPTLEQAVPPSAMPRPKSSRSLSLSPSIDGPTLVSPASTTATFQLLQEPVRETAISVPSPSHGVRTLPNPAPNPLRVASPASVGAASAPPKLRIDFTYIVILSRTPLYQYKTWKPRGHFLEKSLNELITELPFDNHQDVRGLIIRLQGTGVAVEETLNRDEETKFKETKSRFSKVVKMCVKNQTKINPGAELVMNFEMEALREGEAEGEDEEDDDIVF